MRLVPLVLAGAMAAALLTGCGGESTRTTEGSKAAVDPEAVEQRDRREAAVADAKSAFRSSPQNAQACQELAVAYLELASPAAAMEATPPALPDDRSKTVEKATETLRQCDELEPDNRQTKSMLASSLMAGGDPESAAPILADLAKSATGEDRANAYFAWGTAAEQAGDMRSAARAWSAYLRLAPPKDPRREQARRKLDAATE